MVRAKDRVEAAQSPTAKIQREQNHRTTKQMQQVQPMLVATITATATKMSSVTRLTTDTLLIRHHPTVKRKKRILLTERTTMVGTLRLLRMPRTTAKHNTNPPLLSARGTFPWLWQKRTSFLWLIIPSHVGLHQMKSSSNNQIISPKRTVAPLHLLRLRN